MPHAVAAACQRDSESSLETRVSSDLIPVKIKSKNLTHKDKAPSR